MKHGNLTHPIHQRIHDFKANSSTHWANSIWNFTFTLRTPFPQVISCTLGCNECPGAQGMKAFGWRDPPGGTHHFWLNATPLTNTLISKERRVIQFKHVHALLVQHLNGIIFLRSFSELELVIINTYIFQEGLKESSSLDTSEAQVEFLVLLYESDQQVKGLSAYSEWSERLCSKRKVVVNRKWGGWRNQVSCKLQGCMELQRSVKWVEKSQHLLCLVEMNSVSKCESIEASVRRAVKRGRSWEMCLLTITN